MSQCNRHGCFTVSIYDQDITLKYIEPNNHQVYILFHNIPVHYNNNFTEDINLNGIIPSNY